MNRPVTCLLPVLLPIVMFALPIRGESDNLLLRPSGSDGVPRQSLRTDRVSPLPSIGQPRGDALPVLLNTARIPLVAFRKAHILDAVEYLQNEVSRANTTSRLDIVVAVQDPDIAGSRASRLLTMTMRDVPVGDVLRSVCAQLGLQMRVDGPTVLLVGAAETGIERGTKVVANAETGRAQLGVKEGDLSLLVTNGATHVSLAIKRWSRGLLWTETYSAFTQRVWVLSFAPVYEVDYGGYLVEDHVTWVLSNVLNDVSSVRVERLPDRWGHSDHITFTNGPATPTNSTSGAVRATHEK